MSTITISRQFGAGGRTLGKILSKKLGYYCADDVMVKEVADRMNVSTKDVQGFEKEGASNLMKMLDKFISKDYINRLISDRYGYVYEEKYVDSVKAIVQGLHNSGNVVIIGRGSQYILQDEENTLHILLMRELDDRANFLASKYDINVSEARKTVARADKLRKNFLRFFTDNENHDDPLCYDMTINMSRVGMDKAVDLILGLLP
jgi:cytidylate kinase